MDTEHALKRAISVRRQLASNDLVSTSTRKAVLGFLDAIVPYLAGQRDKVEVASAPAPTVQYGLLQYPGDALLEGPSDAISIFARMSHYDPEGVRVVYRNGEKAPWTPVTQ